VGVVTLPKILRDHLRRYPAMQVQDLYKLLYQAALGSEHAIRDAGSARLWLEHEMKEMGDGPEEPLLDPISPDGEMVRIHLRPYRKAGMDPQALLAAFLRTAEEYRGSTETLLTYSQAAARLPGMEKWSFGRVEIETFFAKMGTENYPAVHHSGIYVELYRPAYRVVKKSFLEAA